MVTTHSVNEAVIQFMPNALADLTCSYLYGMHLIFSHSGMLMASALHGNRIWLVLRSEHVIRSEHDNELVIVDLVTGHSNHRSMDLVDLQCVSDDGTLFGDAGTHTVGMADNFYSWLAICC